jgi:hypothetical protein
MEQKIDSNRYKFAVKLINNVCFEIIAVRKKDNKKSSITNLNTIISEILYPVLGTINIEDTSLTVENSQKGKKLFDFAVETFNDTYWVCNYLEVDLDEDFY